MLNFGPFNLPLQAVRHVSKVPDRDRTLVREVKPTALAQEVIYGLLVRHLRGELRHRYADFALGPFPLVAFHLAQLLMFKKYKND